MGDLVKVVRKGRFVGWYVRYKDVDGRRKQRASHQPTRELARRYLVEVEARVARGIIGIPEPAPPGPTLSALVERFLAEYTRPRIKDLERYRMHVRTALRRALPILGERDAGALGTDDFLRLRDQLTRRCAANSVRLTLSYLGTVYAWALRSGVLCRNPLRGLEAPARRDCIEYLSKDEVRALLATAEEQARSGELAARMRHAFLHIAVHTGLRKGELFGLRWRDLDLERRRLSVERSYRTTPKGGQTRHLRLPDVCAGILQSWSAACPRTADGLVFPLLDGQRARKPRMGKPDDMLELPELLAQASCRALARPWHAMRHTFASHYVMAGGNLLALQKILGHADLKMTTVYAHLAPDFLADEMNRVRF